MFERIGKRAREPSSSLSQSSENCSSAARSLLIPLQTHANENIRQGSRVSAPQSEKLIERFLLAILSVPQGLAGLHVADHGNEFLLLAELDLIHA